MRQSGNDGLSLTVQRKLEGIVFSDRGDAAEFMALDWVQQALYRALGFTPFPATLNLCPKSFDDAAVWEAATQQLKGIDVFPRAAEYCHARVFPAVISGLAGGATVPCAVLLPEIEGYPKNKIEVVAAVRLKERFGVRDGDSLTLEFIR